MGGGGGEYTWTRSVNPIKFSMAASVKEALSLLSVPSVLRTCSHSSLAGSGMPCVDLARSGACAGPSL